jgi:copper(I)-binding protein
MRIGLIFAALSMLPLAGSPASAHEAKVGDLILHHPWTRATPAGARVAGGFTEIENKGKMADRLVSASFDASDSVEIHSMEMKDGVMTMRPIAGGLVIPPGETVKLEPGGIHLMFLGLEHKLEEGGMVPGTLVFEKAGAVAVEFVVEAIAATPVHEHQAGKE